MPLQSGLKFQVFCHSKKYNNIHEIIVGKVATCPHCKESKRKVKRICTAIKSQSDEQLVEKKLNKINSRREFFAVSLEEIKNEVRKNFDKTVEWVDIPEAEQYRQSLLLK